MLFNQFHIFFPHCSPVFPPPGNTCNWWHLLLIILLPYLTMWTCCYRYVKVIERDLRKTNKVTLNPLMNRNVVTLCLPHVTSLPQVGVSSKATIISMKTQYEQEFSTRTLFVCVCDLLGCMFCRCSSSTPPTRHPNYNQILEQPRPLPSTGWPRRQQESCLKYLDNKEKQIRNYTNPFHKLHHPCWRKIFYLLCQIFTQRF